ncbi:hypothetical protein EJ04DRAFT_295336 [Polyplosphaeria fusca]|uniref:Serine/threonine-protein kinase MEC1 n=1 Tax=Polyplosphaeria fusca TaxID=682080 RepID=A0A9P4QXQ2_9PLEO|nr:hypothetical protein EJ04DRAFT_295336 [Polyplosphaeria fusca]
MARKGGGSIQRQPVASIANGNQPPPSTIAAQIVSNAANAKGPQQTGAKVVFSDLLKEFLDDPSTDEPNSQLNAQLISVVADAGLDALLQDNLFALDLLLSQAKDSIDVIKVTLQRRPHLLLNEKDAEGDGSPRPPLYIWLLPKLLGLLGHPNFEPIQESLSDLLRTAFTLLVRSHATWRQAKSVLQLYRSCIDSVIIAFHDFCSTSQPSDREFKVILPPSSGISDFWPDSQQYVALPQGSQRTVTSPLHAIVIGLRLLNVVVDVSSPSDAPPLPPFSSVDHFPWALEHATQLWQTFKQFGPQAERAKLQQSVLSAYIHILERLCLPSSNLDSSFCRSSKAAISVSASVLDLVETCSKLPFSEANQVRLASLLTRLRGSLELLEISTPGSRRRSHNSKSLVSETLESGIHHICHDGPSFSPLQKDLKLALCLWTSPSEWPPEINELRNMLCSEAEQSFSDLQLQQDSNSFVHTFKKLNFEDQDRPAKRQKRVANNEQESNDSYADLISKINGSLPEAPVIGLTSLYETSVDTFMSFSDDSERCDFLDAFGKIACSGARCLQSTTAGQMTCKLCDNLEMAPRHPETYWNNHRDRGDDWKDVIAGLLSITESQDLRDSSKPRVFLALAIRRVFNHISAADYLSLETCALGQWLLGSMNRSLRELRIAAVQAVMVFLRDDIPRSVRTRNRLSTLEFLQTLSRRDILSEQETLIMAYGQAARVCGEDELPIILLQLVDYLGHTNALISGMAYNELASIAVSLSTTPSELFRPFWSTIGFSVIKDIQNRPQKAQLMSDLTEQSVANLLLSVHTEILPSLVLTKRKDILQRIATARGASILDVCIQPRRNLAGVLALLLCQPINDVDKNAMETLLMMSPAFKENGRDLSYWVKLEPVMVACEVLKFASDQAPSKKEHYQRGFYTLAVLADSKAAQRKSNAKKKILNNFFEMHILGIMTHFTAVLDNPDANHPLQERKRSVGAIGEMVSLAGDHAGLALPQIRACLQSAMTDKHLCDQAFCVWSTLLTVLEEEELVLVIDQTFALIVQTWTCFSDSTQLRAHEAITALIKNHNGLLRSRIEYIPSLGPIPMLAKIEGEFSRLKANVEKPSFLYAFSERCNDENAIVVRHALNELVDFLETNQQVLHEAATSQTPMSALVALARSLLDACDRFHEDHPDIPILCARCLGIVGSLDPYKIETVRDKRTMLVLSNFDVANEVIDFTSFFLERILVQVFLSTTNTKAQGFLAFVMQELLKCCQYDKEVGSQRSRSSQPSYQMKRWFEISDVARSTLTPFLSSRYMIKTNFRNDEAQEYPIYKPDINHSIWLRAFVFDLLHKGKGNNVQIIFPLIARVIRGHDLSISTFVLPYAVLNVVVTGDYKELGHVGTELLTVLDAEIPEDNPQSASRIKQCSENVFQVLDYLALWLQEKKKSVHETRIMAGKTGRGISEMDEIKNIEQISCVERLIEMIPAEVISRRAVECGSYARALYSWEEYFRQERAKAETKGTVFVQDEFLQHLQFIYAQIEEPDSMEGISTHLKILNPEQEVMEHRKAGRWTAAQSWYELSLADKPNDTETQLDLLTCLKESGQYDSILNYVDGFHASNAFSTSTLQFAAEAAWSTGKWSQLEKLLASSADQTPPSLDFNVGVGRALLALRRKEADQFRQIVESLRSGIAKGLSPAVTASLHACHDHLVRLHALYEMEVIGGLSTRLSDRDVILENLDRRLDIVGAYTSDKQYLLGIRRATMHLSQIRFTNLDIASAWLTSARLARKADFVPTAFNAVTHATRLGDDASKIEYSKLMWKEGHQRKAIQSLQGSIAMNAFTEHDSVPLGEPVTVTVSTVSNVSANQQNPNKVKAQAQLLLAKWLDRSGQTKQGTLKANYQAGLLSYPRWEKGHYYLGRHYNKLIDSEKNLPMHKRSHSYLAGEMTKLVIENFIRSTVYGTKYYYQTIPKLLTLWLDLGMEVLNNSNPRSGHDKELFDRKLGFLDQINRHVKRYTNERMPAYVWYTAFPQIITRISHPHRNTWEVLSTIIAKVASTYPQQALWSILAVTRATDDFRRTRGTSVLGKLRAETSKRKGNNLNVSTLISQGERLTSALLSACDAAIEQRVAHVSLSKDLGFNHKLAPCDLVVPIEATMIPNLPTATDSKVIRAHNPFSQDNVTISAFMDDVLVLSSLQRPRKVNVRGSDGKSYGLLCKPKDDLRKDQRLMEFNAMINRALQHDIDCSKRRLYIKTYGVTPLNEECGTIEWVEGLKPMRDIILRLYRQKNTQIDYAELRLLLNEACADPDPAKTAAIFEKRIQKKFAAVLYEWFIETFPEPEAWFAARLRYTRSCAVMSIVGHVLGLGDRHGENVLLEEGNGGTFHVDFNCLFDKGLTFEKPELVPFRLTHNMVDAMGPQGVEGPFRAAAELTYKQLRTHQDTLITILETFVHDPTADFLGGKRKKKIQGVPDTPQEVLESVRGKVGGMMRGESVPLSVEGYVDALIDLARDSKNLASMYIGWCAFF